MDTDGEPTETERLIAATRNEARKTRTLLLWIFIGIPLISGAIWVLVVLAAAGSATSASDNLPAVVDTSTFDASPDTSTTEPVVTTPYTPSAVASFAVTDSTMCSAISDWWADNLEGKGAVNPADAAIYGGSAYRGADPIDQYLSQKGVDSMEEGPLHEECTAHNGFSAAYGLPDETVLAALQHVEGNHP